MKMASSLASSQRCKSAQRSLSAELFLSSQVCIELNTRHRPNLQQWHAISNDALTVFDMLNPI